MKDIEALLKGLGFSDKETQVYLAVLSTGPSPVRKVAVAAGVNRGTTYDILRSLMEQGLVSYYHQEKKQYFVAEPPERLLTVIDERERTLAAARVDISEALPALSSLFAKAGQKPVVKYYEGEAGVRHILADVLAQMATRTPKLYRVYSSSNIRDVLHRAFPDFTKRRIAEGITARVIAIGSGGEEAPLSERRWLTTDEGVPTYTLIYAGRVAFISVAQNGDPRGVILEDAGTAATEELLFDHHWPRLAGEPRATVAKG